ncbi:MAG: hypothetical protein A2W85_08380 [Bacteroidetes bacterium GWF2_41_31]|nr:MAG: hypothetical protein A2W85_08380 [Bacteroidetes bacterium GWF2_41_31]OFZ08821.1 MAG: hypothetical protein A2338_09355 [Bacteroidetes bacterium RIFOXYB12_FULL_41_6]
MRNLKIVFILLLGILALCFSCEKNHLAGEFLLTDEMKAQNPYQKGDSFKLISNTGDTLSWYVKGRSNQVHEMLLGINTKDYYLVETDKASIDLENSIEYVTFYLEMGGQLTSSRNYIIELYNGASGAGFSFDLPLSKESTPYVDSLYVLNRWIMDVFINEATSANKLYYSTEFGIVKIDFSDGSYWELEKIEWADEN